MDIPPPPTCGGGDRVLFDTNRRLLAGGFRLVSHLFRNWASAFGNPPTGPLAGPRIIVYDARDGNHTR